MDKSRRKKFCLSKRVEEYHFIEDGGTDESNTDDDCSSIFKMFHQKALNKCRQLEIEEKLKNEIQSRFNNHQLSYNDYSSNLTANNDYSTRSNSTRSNSAKSNLTTSNSARPNLTKSNLTRSKSINSTPTVNLSALRPINKTLAIPQIETTLQIPTQSIRKTNNNYVINNFEEYHDYQEPFTNVRNRKSTINYRTRQSTIPFERVRRLANDSPYMSPLSPDPKKNKRMLNRKSTTIFKSYCQVDAQTSPLEYQPDHKSLTINDLNSNSGNKSDSSASVISFSKAFVDEPEDIYLDRNVKKNEFNLNEFTTSNKESLRKSKSTNNLSKSIGSLSFEPPQQNNKRSTIIPTTFNETTSKSSNKINSTRKSRSKSFVNLSNSTKNQQSINSPNKKSTRKSLTQSKLNSEIKSRSALLDHEDDREDDERNSINLLNNSEIESIKPSTSKQNTSIKSNTSSLSKRTSKSKNNNSSIDSIVNNDTLSSVSTTLKSKNKSTNSSLRSTRRSSKINSEIVTQINGTSEIVTQINGTSEMVTQVNNLSEIETNDEIDSNDNLIDKKNSEINTVISTCDQTTDSHQKEDLSAKLTSEIFTKDIINSEVVNNIVNNSEIISNINELETNDDESSSEICNISKIDSEIKSNINSTLTTESATKTNNSNIEQDVAKTKFNNSEIYSDINSTLTTELKTKTNNSNIDKDSTKTKYNNSEIKSNLNSTLMTESITKTNNSNLDKDATKTKYNNSEIRSNINSSLMTDSTTKIDNSNLDQDVAKCNNSEIKSNINSKLTTEFSTKINNSNMDQDLTKTKRNSSEIFSNRILELDGSIANLESKNISFDNDYELNDDLDSKIVSKESINDDKYSKITDDEKEEEEESQLHINEDEQSDEEEESEESKDNEDEDVDESKLEITKDDNEESRLDITKDTVNESNSELKNSSFSRIESNFSRISVSFEPSINNSIENNNLNDDDELNTADDKEENNVDKNNFKIPKIPPLNKKQLKPTTSRQPIAKQPLKFYETIVNKTPTIIYPEQQEEEDDQDSLVRRSSRIRVRPLEFWRNQKLKYKKDQETKCFMIEGVEKGFKPVNPFSKKYVREPQQTNKRKLKESNKKLKLPKTEQVEDEDESSAEENKESENETSEEEDERPVKRKRYSPNEESIHQDVNESALVISEKIKKEAAEFYSKSDLVWNPSRQSQGVFIALMNRKKSPKTGTQASGFMKMEPFAEKPRQESADYITKYVVMFGAISVQIGDQPNVFLKSMDSFKVEKHTKYSLRNLRKDEALLYFDVCRSN